MPKEEFTIIFLDLIGHGTFFVFEVDGTIAAFLNVVRRPGRSRHVAYLSTIAVKAVLHGSGFARAVMSDMLSDLQMAGCRRIELTVETDNHRAVRFYQRLGFEIEGTLRRSYRRASEACDIDSHVMALLYS